MIINFICENCNHYIVCEKVKSLTKFHEDAKKDLGIQITMDNCEDYTEGENND